MPARSSPFPLNALRTAARIPIALTALGLITACSPDQPLTAPNKGVASGNGVPFTVGLASPDWQETARILVSQASYTPIQATHVYPILGVAQYLAVQRAEAAIGFDGVETATPSGNGLGAGGRERLETDRGAVAGASVVALSYSFPASAQALEAMVTAQANAGPGQPHPAFATATSG